MGIVYKAIDLQLNRAVAVKALEDRRLMLPGAASRLRAEALAAASFDPDAPVDLTGLNAGFEPARTDYDWLSRDPAEVDRYIADLLCGFGIDAASTRSMVTGAPRLGDAGALAGIRSDLPLYLVAGSADPLNVELALLEVLEQRYRDAGLDDITTDYHPDARHEVFNETNRDEITANLVAWLRRFVA